MPTQGEKKMASGYNRDDDKTHKEFPRIKLTDNKDLIVKVVSYKKGPLKVALTETYQTETKGERQQKFGRMDEVALTNFLASFSEFKSNCEDALKELKKAK